MKKIIMATVLVATTSLFGLGTQSGTDITNSATLTYSAGGVSQPDVTSNTDTFKVDKKVDMILVTTDTDQTEVTPGQTARVTHFKFTNEGNADEYFKFTVYDLANDAEADYDTDKDNEDVVANSLKINCVDDSGTVVINDEAEKIIQVAQDANLTCEVKADIKTDADGGKDKDIMNIELNATAYKDDQSGPEVETTGDDTQDSVDVVFADGESVANGSDANGLGKSASDDNSTKGDTAGDGIETARSGYIIVTPVLDVTKTSCVLSDPVNNTTNPKRIPGAIVRYMFDVNNTGTGDVTNITLSDDVVSQLIVDGRKASAKKDENQTDACVCTTEPQTYISADTTVSGQNVKIEKINVEHGSTQDTAGEKHTCVSFEVEID